MSLALVRSPRNSVAYEGAQPSVKHEILLCLREACHRTIGKEQAAAAAYGVSPSYFSRQLAGLERLTIDQLALCPEVLDEFAALLAKKRGHRLAPRRSPNKLRRRVEKCTHALELARLDLEDAVDDMDSSGVSSVAS